MNILVVEDNPVVSQRLQALLKSEVCISVVAATGEDTWNYLSIHTPDIIFMDVELPDADGRSLAKSIKKRMGNKWLPIVFHSTHVNENNADVISIMGGDDYLTKPARIEDIRQKLESIKPLINVLKKYNIN